MYTITQHTLQTQCQNNIEYFTGELFKPYRDSTFHMRLCRVIVQDILRDLRNTNTLTIENLRTILLSDGGKHFQKYATGVLYMYGISLESSEHIYANLYRGVFSLWLTSGGVI